MNYNVPHQSPIHKIKGIGVSMTKNIKEKIIENKVQPERLSTTSLTNHIQKNVIHNHNQQFIKNYFQDTRQHEHIQVWKNINQKKKSLDNYIIFQHKPQMRNSITTSRDNKQTYLEFPNQHKFNHFQQEKKFIHLHQHKVIAPTVISQPSNDQIQDQSSPNKILIKLQNQIQELKAKQYASRQHFQHIIQQKNQQLKSLAEKAIAEKYQTSGLINKISHQLHLIAQQKQALDSLKTKNNQLIKQLSYTNQLMKQNEQLKKQNLTLKNRINQILYQKENSKSFYQVPNQINVLNKIKFQNQNLQKQVFNLKSSLKQLSLQKQTISREYNELKRVLKQQKRNRQITSIEYSQNQTFRQTIASMEKQLLALKSQLHKSHQKINKIQNQYQEIQKLNKKLNNQLNQQKQLFKQTLLEKEKHFYSSKENQSSKIRQLQLKIILVEKQNLQIKRKYESKVNEINQKQIVQKSDYNIIEQLKKKNLQIRN